ncbi:MAG TPA: glycosyltransferase [Ktedonobacterales bacterium]
MPAEDTTRDVTQQPNDVSVNGATPPTKRRVARKAPSTAAGAKGVAPTTPQTPATTRRAPRQRAAAASASEPAATRSVLTPEIAEPQGAATPETTPLVFKKGGITPANTVFVSLCFEGPDIYSTAGGLGTRVAEFTEALATMGFDTHLIFVGDPNKPAVEDKIEGRLHIKRWAQWISRYYPNGVYDGEEQKLSEYNDTVPYHVYEHIAKPAIEQGKHVVVIGEDWHTAEVMSRVSDVLHWHGLRNRALLMWNCNSLMSLHRINWGRLSYTTTITTVSRYMKHKMWEYGINPLSIPNGIPRRFLNPVDTDAVTRLREVVQRGDPNHTFLFKIGRFDPDKRWMMAVEAVARMKASGKRVSMIIRGGIEPHGGDVLRRAQDLGLRVVNVEAKRPTSLECIDLLREVGEADIYNLRFFVPEEFVRMCYAAADATLANSGHEPFGLVGLEVMAARGIAFTGSTGEDYAISFENAVALETEDPDEIVGYLTHIQQHPEEREKIRAEAYRTASEFVWEEVIDNLIGKLGYLARKQNLSLD